MIKKRFVITTALSVIFPMVAMETNSTSFQEKGALPFGGELYNETVKMDVVAEQMTDEQIDEENKRIINLLDTFAHTITTMNEPAQIVWYQAMDFLTNDIILVRFKDTKYKEFDQLQKVFGAMKSAPKKGRWQYLLLNH